jgi:hypothetical protein
VTGIGKLATLLDDPEARDLIFGLAHIGAAHPAPPGAPRLHALVCDLAATAAAGQYLSWLSDDARNQAMTAGQVRTAIGDGAIGDIAAYAGSTPDAVAWQLAVLLPDLVDAVSPGGAVVDAALLADQIDAASLEDDLESGSFGSHLH